MPASFVPRSRRLAAALALLCGLLLVVGSPPVPVVRGAAHVPHSRLNGPPATGSGANPAYPLNHMLDTVRSTVGTPPTNDDFETPAASVGTPPANSGFSTGDFTGWTTSGTTAIGADSGNDYASLGSSATILSSAFTLDGRASSISLRAKYPSGIFAGQFSVSLLSGSGYTTSTTLATNVATTTRWQTFSYGVGTLAGQSVEIKVVQNAFTVAVDDVGLQTQDVPAWTVSGTASEGAGGPTGHYVSTTGTITSSPFTLASNEQQLSLSYSGSGSSVLFYVSLLSGTGYATRIDLGNGTVQATPGTWQTFKAGVSAFAGQQVEIQVQRYTGTVYTDNVGVGERLLSGWTLAAVDPIAGGADGNGSYVLPFNPNGGLQIQSSTISPGIVSPPGGPAGQKYYALGYDIGYSTGNLLTVSWVNASTGGVAPVSWTPEDWGQRALRKESRCRGERRTSPIRQRSGPRPSGWCTKGTQPAPARRRPGLLGRGDPHLGQASTAGCRRAQRRVDHPGARGAAPAAGREPGAAPGARPVKKPRPANVA
ncbi:MAG TPA: hypothetical protein VKV26_25465 [Dehalococcoidia bacterium]|nr:hypothetical protein [Dehalococcoidia bacterium]